MNILLPKRIDGKEPIKLYDAKQITVIGANGAGKTRFCRKLLDTYKEKAHKVSVLKAIFPETEKNILPGSIDLLFDEATTTSHFLKSEASTEFDKTMYLLLHDEFIELLKYKTDLLSGKQAKVPRTKLDTVVKMWEDIFPNNKILRESGKLLFLSQSGNEFYSALRLSDGEKAILYYIGSVLYAKPNAVVFVDDPAVFIHPSMMTALWNAIEQMRPDCTFIYNTHDIEFAISRLDNKCVWVKSFDAENESWDYEVVGSQNLSEELYIDLLGSRKPILFVEGDEMHSIDSKLYPLVFTEFTIKPLGSCNKVIESTRSFNDLNKFHHLDSYGIVDRDRRDSKEVEYLRQRKIFVPDVAEIENILLLPEIIGTIAARRQKDAPKVVARVRKSIINMFQHEYRQQALMHVRHRVKRQMEYRVDCRFSDISELEDHLLELPNEINPRGIYNKLCDDFNRYIATEDYDNILRVYNQKQMLPDSNVAQLCGLDNKDSYLHYLLNVLKENGKDAERIRQAIKKCFRISTVQNNA